MAWMDNRALMICSGLMVCMIAGCAATPGRTRSDDPWRGFNRGIYGFNDTLDRAALKPVAKGYQRVFPSWMRTGISNFFNNLDSTTTILNQLLQGKPGLAAKDTGRFLLNLTAGIGGFIDVAGRAGIAYHEEDFGQTLAVWGVSSGPFLELPFFGPSSLRDAPSRVVDYFTKPTYYADLKWQEEAGIWVVQAIDTRAGLLSADQTLQNAFDPYAFTRDAWMQRREYQIFDGSPPEEPLIDESGVDPEPPKQ